MNKIFNNKLEQDRLLQRFIRYVKVWTTSDSEAANRGVIPSTSCQWDLARMLQSELQTLGLKNVTLTDKCFVYGKFDGDNTKESVLLLAHIDTSESVSGKDVNPVIETRDEDTIIRTDGSTLLGGDDKSGVAIIMSMLDYLVRNKEINHCPIEVMFTPDEETGTGIESVPLELISSKIGITVDGSNEGELEYECFNAVEAKVTFFGKAIHPGYAKEGGLINPVLMASEFVIGLPEKMRPENTENREGYIYPMISNANEEQAEIKLLLRAFTKEEIISQKDIIDRLAKEIGAKYKSKFFVEYRNQYNNMVEIMDQHPELLAKLSTAYKNVGLKVINKPIRGGTDGARLSFMGIPTPNMFDGAHNFHSRDEWASLNEMSKATDVLLDFVSL